MNRAINDKFQAGFTAVELLITLFIAAIFLFAGYQLYAQVIRDGNEAEKTARLSNSVYAKMRTASAAVTGVCSSSTPTVTTATEQVAGIGSVTYTTTRSCPYVGLNVTLVNVKAAYITDGTAKTVDHATYTNGTSS